MLVAGYGDLVEYNLHLTGEEILDVGRNEGKINRLCP
jgi:hypothetical protein